VYVARWDSGTKKVFRNGIRMANLNLIMVLSRDLAPPALRVVVPSSILRGNAKEEAMNYEFRVVPHSMLPGKQAVECWRDGKFVAGIYPHQDGIRIVSKFMTDIIKESGPAYGGQLLPAVIVKLGEKPAF